MRKQHPANPASIGWALLGAGFTRIVEFSVLICCLALSLPVVQAQAPEPGGTGALDAAIEKLQRATVYIETTMVLSGSDWNGLPPEVREKLGKRPQGNASGSGFLISPEGHIITNAHVVSKSTTQVPAGPPGSGKTLELRFMPTSLKVVVRSGQGDERAYAPRVIKLDPGVDLALLKIEADQPFQPLQINPASIDEGEQVLMAGFPGGKLPDQAPFVEHPSDFKQEKNPRVSVNAGMVTAVRKTEKDFRYQLDVRANHGNSGGPIVNIRGEVVGILYAGIDSMQSVNYAIPTRYLALVLPLEMRRGWPVRTDADVELEQSPQGSGPQDYEHFKESIKFELRK